MRGVSGLRSAHPQQLRISHPRRTLHAANGRVHQSTPARMPDLLVRPWSGGHGARTSDAQPQQPQQPPSGDGASRRCLLLSGASVALLTTLAATQPARAQAAQGIDTVFVAGATGATGRRVVQQLRAAGFRVRAGVRDPKKAQSLGLALDAGVTIVTADVTAGVEPLVAAIDGAQAVICATGFKGFNLGAVGSVEEQGTINLVDAAKASGLVQHFTLLSSLLTNARGVGQSDNPNYRFLNLLGGVLDKKLAAERYLRASGLTWTVVRPGGLSDDPPEKVGQLVVSGEDSLFGLPSDPGREISRDTVAAVLVASLQAAGADNKVIEIVASPTAPELPPDRWFTGL